MGVQISKIINPEEIKIDDLTGKKIAIDSFNILFQFLSSIRQFDGTPLMDSKGRVTSHLSGLFYRTGKFMEKGIKPIFVFDGKAPEFKKREQQERRERREEAKEKMEQAVKQQDWESAKKYSQQTSKLTDEMIKESKELINAMGMPVIQAPSEGEAQAAYLAKTKKAWATGSQDWDSLLFGSPKLVQNLSISGRKKRGTQYVQINPLLINLDTTLKELNINQDQLILLGILVGTDFNREGVKGIGPVKGLDLVKTYDTPEKIADNIEWDCKYSVREIFDFFKNPPVQDFDVEFTEINPEKIKKILVDDHDFSEERVEKVIDKIKDAKKVSSLDRWL